MPLNQLTIANINNIYSLDIPIAIANFHNNPRKPKKYPLRMAIPWDQRANGIGKLQNLRCRSFSERRGGPAPVVASIAGSHGTGGNLKYL